MAKQRLLIESSWEVCNQMGGIYTVIRSKLPAIVKKWGSNYALLGPLVNKLIDAEFEDSNTFDGPIGATVLAMRDMGYEVRYGTWLVTGRPKVVLLNPDNVFNRLEVLKRKLKEFYGVDARTGDDLFDEALQWNDLCSTFFKILCEKASSKHEVIGHFHEWLASIALLNINRDNLNCKTVFTTHATMLGRVLAANVPGFYSSIRQLSAEQEARKFGVATLFQIERESAKRCDVFTTVSEVTAQECEILLDRKPDIVTPNGLNIDRYVAVHEVQVRHEMYKKKIHNFIMGHFFSSYSFDLDKTLYFFISGRYEYVNKGFDLTLRALKKLNEMIQKEKLDVTVVVFFITKSEVWSINPDVLQTRVLLEEIKNNCEAIEQQIGEKLFMKAAASEGDHRLPNLNDLIEDYWRLRYRRTIQSWKKEGWPIVVTHNLVNDVDDPILRFLRSNALVNSPMDRVKVVFHPEFITTSSPLFAMDYGQFVRGCHLGIFPSYYEPWGYTPLECIARGVPTVTSDLSGFGRYVQDMNPDAEDTGVYVLRRHKRTDEQSIDDLSKYLLQFVKSSRRYRMIQRNKLEDFSEQFDWKNLISYYEKAYDMAIQA